MYLHIGGNEILPEKRIIGVFDLDQCTCGKRGQEYLRLAEEEGAVLDVSGDIPRTFVVADHPYHRQIIYLTQLSPAALQRRAERGELCEKERKTMEFFAPYAIDDLMHFTRMGSPANVVLPLLMLAAFVGQIFFMLRGGKSSRIVLVKFAFLVLLLSELGRNLDGGGAFLVGIYAAVAVLMGSMTGWVVGVLIEGGRKRRK